MWYSWKMAWTLETFWKFIQVGENEGPTVVVVDKSSKSSSCNDGKECKDQVGDHLVAMRRQSKFPWRMTAALRDSAMIEDILRGSGVCPKSGGRITFYPNMMKNERMWYCWMIL